MLFNPVFISVIVLICLCLIRFNVLISLIISAIVGGLIAGMDITTIINTLVNNMGGNSNTALSYILLGTLASCLAHTGVINIISKKAVSLLGKKNSFILLSIAFISCLSQNLIPIHIAFIPMIIPALLPTFDLLKIDRRAISCSLAFGLEAPYLTIPFGFGAIYHTVISENLTANGMNVAFGDVWKSTWILGLGMIFGLFFAIFISYKKERTYRYIQFNENVDDFPENIEYKHYVAMFAMVVTFVIQIITNSMPFGALCGILFMFLLKAIKLSEMDIIVNMGVKLMGIIAFVMLVASGYGGVLKESGGISKFVESAISLMNGNKVIAAFIMLLVGLFITMGIGTSFGTVPILATLYVPICMQLGFSVGGTIILIAAAGALGDAGSPASDTTLGPTSGLNADGQHNHIQDTCIPTFLHYNIPLILFGLIGSLI